MEISRTRLVAGFAAALVVSLGAAPATEALSDARSSPSYASLTPYQIGYTETMRYLGAGQAVNCSKVAIASDVQDTALAVSGCQAAKERFAGSRGQEARTSAQAACLRRFPNPDTHYWIGGRNSCDPRRGQGRAPMY